MVGRPEDLESKASLVYTGRILSKTKQNQTTKANEPPPPSPGVSAMLGCGSRCWLEQQWEVAKGRESRQTGFPSTLRNRTQGSVNLKGLALREMNQETKWYTSNPI